MKIVDSFMFYNELDMLFYRLNILGPHVDYFIIVESNQSHSGNQKPLFYEDNKHLFETFKDKIIHVICDLPYKYPYVNISKNDQWKNENYNRNCIEKGIQQINLEPNDVIITSDLDEIIDPNILLKIKNDELLFDKHNLNRVQMDMYYYNLNNLHGKGSWHGVKVITYDAYIKIKFT